MIVEIIQETKHLNHIAIAADYLKFEIAGYIDLKKFMTIPQIRGDEKYVDHVTLYDPNTGKITFHTHPQTVSQQEFGEIPDIFRILPSNVDLHNGILSALAQRRMGQAICFAEIILTSFGVLIFNPRVQLIEFIDEQDDDAVIMDIIDSNLGNIMFELLEEKHNTIPSLFQSFEKKINNDVLNEMGFHTRFVGFPSANENEFLEALSFLPMLCSLPSHSSLKQHLIQFAT